MHVRVRLLGKTDTIVVVESKLTKIDQFRKIIKDKFDVEPALQCLLYGGKLLENGYTFHDYNIKLNDVIQLMPRLKPQEPAKGTEEPSKSVGNTEELDSKKKYEDTTSKFYATGDLVDVLDRTEGCWYEGQVARIVRDPEAQVNTSDSNISETDENCPPNTVKPGQNKAKGIASYFTKALIKKPKKEPSKRTEEGVLYQIKWESEEDEPMYCKFHEIRPRARTTVDVKDLVVGTTYMVNHNPNLPLEKGDWYDFKLAEVVKLRTSYHLRGTLYLGPDAVPQDDTEIALHDKVFAIEQVVELSERTEEYLKNISTDPEKRSNPLICLKCRDDEDAPCQECGCYICSGKEFPDKIVLCDECNHGYHMICLDPPLVALPEDDWYCPGCKRDTTEVIAPGAAKQVKKHSARDTKRDWGRGMACVGKTKTCEMPANHFGPIPGIEVGMCWRFRIQLSESGVHRPPVSGIHGRDVEGAYSIVLSGGYEDDVDNGYEFTYTGSGGRDLSGNKRTAEQSCDQTLTRENKALARNCAVKEVSLEGGDAGEQWRSGKPVRVVRSYKMIKHFPKYAPKEGIRYDGIYKVVKYYPEKGLSGFIVWKYQLRRDDPTPAPWEPHAKQYPIVYPDGYLEAEAEKKALKAQGSKRGKGGEGKGAKRKIMPIDSDFSSDEDSPPPKKRKPKSKLFSNERIKVKLPPMKRLNKSVSKPDEKAVSLMREAVAGDTLNAKVWDECLIVLEARGETEFVTYVREMFVCSICQQVTVAPITTPCLHNFCQACLKLAYKSSPTCPHCRAKLSQEQLTPNDNLKSALQAIMPGYDGGK